MTIAVHEASNSLIVTAPRSLFEEVEALALQIDQRSRRTIEILRVPDGVDMDSIEQLLSGATGISKSSTKSSKSKSR